jgi:excisionase family DNA binding protein
MANPMSKPKILYPWLQKPNEQLSAPPPPPPPAQNVEPVPRLALTIHEVAMALSISVGTLNKLVQSGKGPPSFIVPGGRLRRFPTDAVRRWVNAQVGETEPSIEPPRTDC